MDEKPRRTLQLAEVKQTALPRHAQGGIVGEVSLCGFSQIAGEFRDNKMTQEVHAAHKSGRGQ